MMTFITTIQAINPETGLLCTWAGPNIQAISWSDAEEQKKRLNLNYCKIEGILQSEVPCDDEWNPDWDNEVFYTNEN